MEIVRGGEGDGEDGSLSISLIPGSSGVDIWDW